MSSTEEQLKKRVQILEEGLVKREECIQGLRTQIQELSCDGGAIEWPAERIRQTFVDFFGKHKSLPHDFYASCPVVPLDDPTLLFINAGMNQFKPIFLGQVDPSHPMAKLQRATNSQKCIRAGGKHNDLDDVGKDVYHHTFFEMLGNWSFGDYFKKEAVEMSWTLLTEVYKLDPNRLYATYFGGDAKQNLPSDEETKQLWLKYLPIERVLPFDCKDNFWEMGEVGPCGPCTEIHYDRIGNRDAGPMVNADLPDVIEIWNNVFIQFNREQDGSLVPLPNKHVDTGMGFERLASILQGKTSNYDTDVFMPLFGAIQALCKSNPYTGKLGNEDPTLKDMAYRVVADHIRTLTFAITDGAVPSNDGRGYVLRRILRRAVRYGEQFLNAPSGFLTKLVPVVVKMLGGAFPELLTKVNYVSEIIYDEEISFGKTLNKGLDRFKKMAAQLKSYNANKNEKLVLSGPDAFFLYDSMGFPLDLTEIMAEEEGMLVDVEGFKLQMKLQSERSKLDRKKGNQSGARPLVLEANETSHLQSQGVKPTNDDQKYHWYEGLNAEIVAIFATTEKTAKFVQSTTAKEYERVGVILNQTSFYAQSGGQIYDTGFLQSNDKSTSFAVDSVESYGGYVLHMGPLTKGALKVGDKVVSQVDYVRREKIAPNHTMTHVLNYALRKVLGTTVDQRGSLVDENRLRFDFTTNKPLKADQIASVEQICNDVIERKLPIFIETAPQAQAKRIQSLRAVFGETYPDFVRVVSIGQGIQPMLKDPENSSWSDYSVEFCGGTHLKNTKDALEFVLYEESAIAKGIRRISAYTGGAAAEASTRADIIAKSLQDLSEIKDNSEFISSVTAFKPVLDAALISLPAKDRLRKKLDGLIEKVKKMKKDLAALRAANGVQDAATFATQTKSKSENFVVVSMEVGTDAKLGRDMLQSMADILPNGSFMIFSVDSETQKTAAFCQVSQKHNTEISLNAKDWVNHAMTCMDGKGGGKDALNATGQAKTTANLDQAITSAKEYVSKK